MKSNLFRWGIIGPGRIAHTFAEGFKVIENAEVYAVASRDAGRASEFANEHNIEVVYNSYKKLLEDKNIDAVYIATPVRFHYEQVDLALEAGKAVLCEKPFTVNASEAGKLIDKAREKKLFLMEAMWTRYLPVYSQIRHWLNEGCIGDIKLLTSTFSFNFPRNEQGRLLNHQLGGGALLDLGIYPISISQWVLNQNPIEISVSGILGSTNVDEMVAANFKYDTDVISQFCTGMTTKTGNDFYVYGSKGHIRIHSMFWVATQATLSVDDKETVAIKPFRANGFEYETEEAMHCINEGKLESPGMTLQDTLANMQLMDNIRKEIGLTYDFE